MGSVGSGLTESAAKIAVAGGHGYKQSVGGRQGNLGGVTAIVLPALLAAGLAGAQTRPLRTEEATTAPAGQIVFETGFQAIAAEPSYLTGIERTRWDGPLLRFVYSPADGVEVDLEWVAAVGAASGGGERGVWDSGDVSLRTKLRFLKGRGRRPTLAARFGVALPQTSYEDRELGPLGLGPNTIRVYVEALLTQPLGPVELDVNAGLFLHDEVSRLHDQVDFLSYALAARWSVRPGWEIVGEVAGRAGKGKPDVPERSEARIGVRFSRGRLRADAAVRRGLIGEQGTWGGTAGLTWTIRPGS
jgi:hypothetical protein